MAKLILVAMLIIAGCAPVNRDLVRLENLQQVLIEVDAHNAQHAINEHIAAANDNFVFMGTKLAEIEAKLADLDDAVKFLQLSRSVKKGEWP